MSEPTTTSTRPYLIRALHEWCTDNGLTPYLSVRVDRSVQVPREFVQGGEITLNVSYDATGSLQIGNEYIEFKARFGGKPRDILVPVDRVQAIYARESGQGMSFPVVEDVLSDLSDESGALELNASMDADASSVDANADATPAHVVQLVTASSKPVETDGEGPRPPAGGVGRPSLKRVK